MKKYTVALVLLSVLPVLSAGAYQYNSQSNNYYSGRQATHKKPTNVRKSGGYNNTITNNFYYTSQQPQRSSQQFDANKNSARQPLSYENADYNKYATKQPSAKKQKTVTKQSYSSQERKFFLAHPFFQPLQGHVGSITDFAYAQNSFKFDMLNGSVVGMNPYHAPIYGKLNPALSGKAQTNQFTVKEDLSIGLSDTLAVIGMVQYDRTKVAFKDWSTGDAQNSTSDSGINIFGIGLQNRFVDNDEWIAMLAGYFQHQKDTANTFIGELKVGYKINRTTVYGLGRFGYSNLIKGDTYGAYVNDNAGDWLMLSYKTDVADVIYAEGGIGAFAVLNKFFTLNGELIYGHYDWHNQLNIKGAIGFQPADSFALNLYASTSLYDSAKNKTKMYMNYDVNPTDYPRNPSTGLPVYTDSNVLYTTGDYNIKNYNEWKIGVQAILYF